MTIMTHNEMFGEQEQEDWFDCPYHECDGSGWIKQEEELKRFYSDLKCRCNPTYNEATERMRVYS